MVGHGGSSAGSYLADATSPIPSHCASIAATSTLRVKLLQVTLFVLTYIMYVIFSRKSRKCESNFLSETRNKSQITSKGEINKIKIIKIVHPKISMLKALLQRYIERVVSINISIFQYIIEALPCTSSIKLL